jgi:uncharacterized protein DUF6283
MPAKPPARITRRRPAGEDHNVLTALGGSGGYRHRPCDPIPERGSAGCPWRTDQVGQFPPQAFRISAPTAYDLAGAMFGCHNSPHKHPATCAGFLLRGADHNLGARHAVIEGRIDLDLVDDGGHSLWPSYRAMAVANGVDPDDRVLQPCRDPGYPED